MHLSTLFLKYQSIAMEMLSLLKNLLRQLEDQVEPFAVAQRDPHWICFHP